MLQDCIPKVTVPGRQVGGDNVGVCGDVVHPDLKGLCIRQAWAEGVIRHQTVQVWPGQVGHGQCVK